MQEDFEQHVCVFVASDCSLWTKKLSELQEAGNAEVCAAGSKVTFRLPVHYLTQPGEDMVTCEQDYKGTVLFHCPGLNPCKEKQQVLQGFIDEKRHLPGPVILDFLLELVKDANPLTSCNLQSAKITAEESMGPTCKKVKISDGHPHFAIASVQKPHKPPLHNTWSPPPVSVKSEQSGAPRFLTELEEDSFHISMVDFESVEDSEEENKDEGNSDKNNPFAVLENLIKENQSLKKENARLKQMLLAAQNAAPFRLLTRETRDSAAYYLRLVLENLEKTNSSDPSPSTSELMNQLSVPKATNMQRKVPLFTDGTSQFSDILVNPAKIREIVMTAKKGQTVNPARYLMNKLLEILFTKEELRAAKGALSLDSHRQEAIKEFIHIKSKEIGFAELSTSEYRKALQNKIGNLRLKQKEPELFYSIETVSRPPGSTEDSMMSVRVPGKTHAKDKNVVADPDDDNA